MLDPRRRLNRRIKYFFIFYSIEYGKIRFFQNISIRLHYPLGISFENFIERKYEKLNELQSFEVDPAELDITCSLNFNQYFFKSVQIIF